MLSTSKVLTTVGGCERVNGLGSPRPMVAEGLSNVALVPEAGSASKTCERLLGVTEVVRPSGEGIALGVPWLVLETLLPAAAAAAAAAAVRDLVIGLGGPGGTKEEDGPAMSSC